MQLFLLRHAEASDFYPDAERPLTTKGRNDATLLGKRLARQEVELPETIWSSPYLRARETAQLLVEGFEGTQVPKVRDGITPYDDPADLLEELAERKEDLLIVGHNPYLAMLSSYLLGGLSGDVSVHYRKAAMICFDRIKRYSNEKEPAWVLEWMLMPKLYR